MNEFKSNSHKAKEENLPDKKKVEKVIKGDVKTKKKSSSQKLAEVFISEDITNVRSYIFSDVLIPALKDTLYEAVTSGLSMLLGGEGGSIGFNRSSSKSKESYNKYYKSSSRTGSTSTRSGQNSRYKYDDILFDSRGEAEEVLDVLTGLIEEYGMVSLLDFHDAVGVPSNYTDDKYGWCDLRTAAIAGNRSSGYIIKMPRIMPLD